MSSDKLDELFLTPEESRKKTLTKLAEWIKEQNCSVESWDTAFKRFKDDNPIVLNQFFIIAEKITGTKLSLIKAQHKHFKKERKEIAQEINETKTLLPPKNDKEFREKLLICLISRRRQEATELLVTTFLKKERVYSIRTDEIPEMYIYKEGIYVPSAKTFIKEHCRKYLGEAFTTQIFNEVINKVEVDTYINQDELFQNINVNEIAVENGILKLKTKEILPFTPDKIFFNKLPVIFDIKKECTNIKKHFKTVLYEEDISAMEEIFGYLLLKSYPIHKAIMFSGGGRNGKGKTLELMKRFLGSDNCANISLQDLEEDSFALGELFNKMANISGDLSPAALNNTGNFKSITGEDLLSANRKFKTRINFQNYSKQIFAANELPITKDLTLAFFNRWVIIDFPYTFLSAKEIGTLTEEQKEKVKLADGKLMNKLTTPEELSGLLNLALVGLQRLLLSSDFSYSKSTAEVKNTWIRKSNSVEAFILDCIIEDQDSFISKQELKKEYITYCKKHNVKILSDKIIKNTLSNLGIYDEKITTNNNKRVNVWNGLRLNDKITSVKGVKGVNSILPYREVIKFPLGVKTPDCMDTLDIYVRNNLNFNTLRKKISEYLKKEGKISQNNLINLLEKEGLPESKSELFINQMKNAGDLFEKPSGILRLLN